MQSAQLPPFSARIPTDNYPLIHAAMNDSRELEGDNSSSTAFYDLSSFGCPEYDPGRGVVIRALWYYCSLLLFESGWFLSSRVKSRILRAFGANVGRGLVIKPHVRIKFPWRLTIGDHCWVGQNSWIDNIEDVKIGSHVCISQLCYFCTGSHDHRSKTFDLLAKPIQVHDGAWIGARALLLGGIEVGTNAVVAAGSVVTKDVSANAFAGGTPAKEFGRRN